MMLKNEIQLELDALRIETGSDFSALAEVDRMLRRIEWKYVSGHLTDRYLEMTGRAGRGIDGLVLRHGRSLISGVNAPGDPAETPIMAAEYLQSAAAVPVTDGGDIIGVLLVGMRAARTYSPEDVERIYRTAERLTRLQEMKRWNPSFH